MLYSYVLYWKMMFLKSNLMFCIENEVKSYVFVLKNEEWGFLKTLSKKVLHSYVVYWKMMCLKSILLFCIEKWGMRISKNSFRKKCCILMCYIEKWGFWSQFFCFVLKMRISKNSFVKKFYSYVLYWKMMFLKSILLFCIEKWGMRIS